MIMLKTILAGLYADTTTFIITVLLPLITWLMYFVFQPAISQRKQKYDKSIVIEERLFLHEKTGNEGGGKSKHLLSLVIPAYNEELRLPPMLLSTINKLKSSRQEIMKLCNDIHESISQSTSRDQTIGGQIETPFEIIIVNDGSKDETLSRVRNVLHSNFGNNLERDLDGITIHLLSLKKNCGKGAAVRAGMLHSSGSLCLMVDADDATNFLPSLLSLLTEMKQMTTPISIGETQKEKSSMIPKNNKKSQLSVFGSRAHLQDDSKAKRSFVRTVLMIAFHFFVETLCSTLIRDTQCGFKLFTRDAALILFQNLHLTRWAFDTELVVIAQKMNIPIAEVGVEWQEVDGSKLASTKLNLLISSIEMLRDMLCVKIMYMLRLWRLKSLR